MQENIQSTVTAVRRSANIGLYGSIAAVILTVIFHFSPWTFRQSAVVSRWMLLSGIVLAVLAIVMVLMMIRKTTPHIRMMDTLEEKLPAYRTYINNLYLGTLAIVVMECLLIVLTSDNSLLMVTMLLVLCLFISYPNMYKMKNDLGLLQEEFNELFPEYAETPEQEGSEYIPEEEADDTAEEGLEETATDESRQ